MTTPDTDVETLIAEALAQNYTGSKRPCGNYRVAAVQVVRALRDAEPHHFVTFDADGWFIEHSMACRLDGTIGTCNFNKAIREIADDFDPDVDADQLGRWRITWIDSEGLPSLERAEGT